MKKSAIGLVCVAILLMAPASATEHHIAKYEIVRDILVASDRKNNEIKAYIWELYTKVTIGR